MTYEQCDMSYCYGNEQRTIFDCIGSQVITLIETLVSVVFYFK